jgi:hypothetical protein
VALFEVPCWFAASGKIDSLNLSISQVEVIMTKQQLQPPRQSAKGAVKIADVKIKLGPAIEQPTAAPKARQIHKEGEVNISAYFPAEVKACLRMVQAKTGNNVKDCLGEALRDLFKKHDVHISVELGKGR